MGLPQYDRGFQCDVKTPNFELCVLLINQISEEEMKKLNVLLLSEIKRKLNNPCDVLQAPAEFHTENEYRPNEKASK